MTDKKRQLIKYISIGVGVFLAIYTGLSVYGAREAMEIPCLPLSYSTDALGLACDNVSFPGRGNSMVLRGWYVSGQNDNVIIIVHGGFQNRIDDNVDTLGLTRGLVKAGYGVLLYDLRGRGESEGKGQTLSNIGEDIGGAVDYLKGRGYGEENICIMGFCSGAAAVCIYASQNSVGALILDGCFIDVPTMVARQGKSIGIPPFLTYFFVPGGLVMSRIIYDYHMVNPSDVISEVDCPILFIHEENDELIKREETLKLFRTADNAANEVWEVGGAQHSQGFRTQPAEYIKKIDEFLSTRMQDIPTD